MNEPIFKASEIAWIRLQSPDLAIAEKFLTDFGMHLSERTDDTLYMRGTDTDHHIHITHLGPPKVLSVAFHADSEADLERLANNGTGASPIEPINEPGGGKRVRLTEHNGFEIEVVHGVAQVSPLSVRRFKYNTGYNRDRLGNLLRVSTAPSQVKRIAHAVFSTPDIRPSIAWAQRHLGLVTSENVHAEENKDDLLASFNRLDRGAEYVDHHVVMFGKHERAGLNHISFEIQDIDDLWSGHEFLMQQGYEHCWGIGRHTLGSQVFDYWFDPWGRMHEHWTDSDLLNNEHPFSLFPRSTGLRSQWGPQAPQAFRDSASR